MPLDPSERDHLLESQVRDIDGMISAAGSRLGEFEWGRCGGGFAGYVDGSTPCVHLQDRDFFFAFARIPTSALESAMARSRYGKNSGEHWTQFSPGAETLSETHREMKWDEVLFQFDRWLSFVAREAGIPYRTTRSEPTKDPRRTLAPTGSPPTQVREPERTVEAERNAQVALPAPPPKPLELPPRVTLRWVIDHAPVSLWLKAGALMLTVFVAGVGFGTSDVVLEFRRKDVRTLDNRTAELQKDSAALQRRVDSLTSASRRVESAPRK